MDTKKEFWTQGVANIGEHKQRYGQAIMNAYRSVVESWDRNPDGTRTILTASGKVLPDIWEVDVPLAEGDPYNIYKWWDAVGSDDA